MDKQIHPSLRRIYSCDNEDTILYIDETYSTQEENQDETFYVLTASMYKKGELDTLRQELKTIVGGGYWHSTEAMQTTEGRKKFVALLKYLSEYEDKSILTCKTPIPPPRRTNNDGATFAKPHVEKARGDCIEELLNWASEDVNRLAGIVFEKRAQETDNNRDRKKLKDLGENNATLKCTPRAWVSPSEEHALWVPDTVCTAYRRTRTHTDATAKYFFDYLNHITEVREF